MGSTTHIVDETGKVQNRYEYDAWGNLTLCEEKISNRFKFTGQQLDPITQQYYLRARFYNPVIARFTQEDTYRGDGLNLYAYCANNPVYYTDPSGFKKSACYKDAYEKYTYILTQKYIDQGFSEVEANRIARKKHKKEIDRAAKAIRDENRRGTTAWTDGSKFPNRTLNAQMEAQYVAAVTNRLFGKSMYDHPSITVLTHGDGSVSVGFSGEMDVNLTDQVFTELTRLQHERGETALNTQYRVSTEGMPKELLTEPISSESKSKPPELNNCSEPKAMVAAHGSGEAITGIDTVWRTDPMPGEKHVPYYHNYRKENLPWVYEQMGPCKTCRTNKGAYFNYATS